MTQVICLRCGRWLPRDAAVRDDAGAGWYHEGCASEGGSSWGYTPLRETALRALYEGELVLHVGWWVRPARAADEEAIQICGPSVMRRLTDDGLAVRTGDDPPRARLAPHLEKS
jgi:hypothetical protein